MTYYGGKVLSNVKVVFVLYGSGPYSPYMTNDAAPSMSSFYQQVVNSSYLAWLCEYSTPTQTIGPGTYAGKYQITPAATNNTARIRDSHIQTELGQQILAGNLPAPDSNTVYMVHFPAGKVIVGPVGTGDSCVDFCAYHSTAMIGTNELYYAVLPDFSGGCASGCGSTGTQFGDLCSSASHELIESITDPEVGLDTSINYAYPCAWGDNTYGEIGDVCGGMPGADAILIGNDGLAYTVQKGFSNYANDCVAASPPPLAFNQNFTNYQNSPLPLTLSGSDSNSYCPNPLTFAVSTSPAHGGLSGTAPNLTYTPATGFVGQDNFQFQANDGFQNSSPAAVSITVIPNNALIVPPVLNGGTILANGAFQFSFTNNQGAGFTVLASTDLTLPLTNWTVVGALTNDGSGFYQFTDAQASNNTTRFYRVRSP